MGLKHIKGIIETKNNAISLYIMYASNKLGEELLFRYSDFGPLIEEQFVGCKVAEKKTTTIALQ